MKSRTSNYLKTIYETSYAQRWTCNKQIATMLGVLPGSVTEAVDRLISQKLVVKNKGQIKLTKRGYQLVTDLMYRYRLCEIWLADNIQLSLPEVPRQAWLMSAIDSSVVMAKLNQQMAYPKTSPFGGALKLESFSKYQHPTLLSLLSIPVGKEVKIISFLETPATIHYFQHSGLHLGQVLTINSKNTVLPNISITDVKDNEYLIDNSMAVYIYCELLS
jgi:DtxR family Mn-dependent transcriptional regulator